MAETHDANARRDDMLRDLDESFGAWPDRDYDGASYVEALPAEAPPGVSLARSRTSDSHPQTRKRGGRMAAPQVRHVVEGC